MFSRLLLFFDTLRRVIGALFIVALIGLLVSVLLSSRPSVPQGALLVLNPDGDIVEELDPSDTFPPEFSATSQTRLSDVQRALRAARADDRISGILLDVQDMDDASLPALQSLGREITAFRKSGKKVVAYADHYSQTQYHLAAHADEVWLHPMGMVLLTGLSSYRNYFADALQRMHVKIHLFRAGNYKSAAEPLVRNTMSAAAKEETRSVLDQLWQVYKNDISDVRPIKPAAIQTMLDNLQSTLAQYAGDPAAMDMGIHLVDRLGTRSEMMHALSTVSGVAEKDGKPLLIEFRQYLRAIGDAPEKSGAKVGILTASGALTDGILDSGGLNGDDFSELIDKAIQDTSIKAVVLRIDSPGGSVQASETIRRSLLRLSQNGKPLIVSMAGMAASGGYWIAAGADEIWAAPTTLTGSIGVFGIFPDVAASLESLGIHSDGVGTSSLSGGLRPDRPMPKAISDALQTGVDHIYDSFLDIVSKGRHLDSHKTRELAEGRVWSGADGIRLGLVDHLGNLDDAVAAAAKHAGLQDNYGVRRIRAQQDLSERLFDIILGKSGVRLAGMGSLNPLSGGLNPHWMHAGRSAAEWLRMLRPSGGIYAYCGLSPY